MSWRTPIVAAVLIAAASAASIWLDLADTASARQGMQSWSAAHAMHAERPSASASLYWRWRAPSAATLLDDAANTQPATVLNVGAGQEVWAINAAAQRDRRQVPAQAMPLIAVSTAAFLGVQLPDSPEPFRIMSEHILSGLDPWRTELASRCGDCAPPPAPFPTPAAPMQTSSHGFDPRAATGVSIAVERYRRSVLPPMGAPSPMTAMVRRIREGGQPTAEEWATPGLAGMGALELGARMNVAALPAILAVATKGPSATDEVAALWAAKLLGGQHPDLQTIEAAL